MSDPLLNYQPVLAPRSTRRTAAAWIATLVLGILYALGGLCVGFGGALAVYLISRGEPVGGGGLTIVILVMSLFILYIEGNGTLLIFGAFRIRRGSRGWALGCLWLAAINSGLVLIILALGLIGAMAREEYDPAMIFALLVHLVTAGVSIAVAVVLYRALRDLRPRVSANPLGIDTAQGRMAP